MKWIVDLAFRNIKRNRRRTVLAVSSIALAVMLTTFLNGFMGGMLDNIVKNLTKNDTGHIRISTAEFAERAQFMPVNEIIYNPEEITEVIRSIPELDGQIQEITERISFGTMLSSGPRSVSAMGVAGDPEAERDLLNLDRSISKGRYIREQGEVLLGSKAAADLNLDTGMQLGILTQGADYSLRFKNFTIVGLFTTGLKQLDESTFMIPLEDAKTFLRTGGGAQQILVLLKDYRKSAEAALLIRQRLAERAGEPLLAVLSWNEIGDYPALIPMMESVYGWVYVVISLLGAFIISNILMMVVLERRREIGIFKALGLKQRNILALFVTEGAVMGVTGSAAGAALGFILCIINSFCGIDFSAAMEGLNFPMDPVYYSRVDPLGALAMFGIGAAVSVLVSILPSRRGAKMNAVDAIKSAA